MCDSSKSCGAAGICAVRVSMVFWKLGLRLSSNFTAKLAVISSKDEAEHGEISSMDHFAKKHMGLSENVGYIPNYIYSHLIGIMISKTIGFRGTLFSDTPIYNTNKKIRQTHTVSQHTYSIHSFIEPVFGLPQIP